ncbi:hypothetical protein DAEQUDRAFT_767166 [Daedalea quercina L-15889]|uniref:MYND-type domain-containing protein n=1 Tax=Daedalea quercina L-15889 TaxID=1314783 RepID=A0A165NVP7_9APHY|nr:hypothetical protein DAEQUDRAFT_767166 [Daedalea quercina L-15889]
MSDITMECLKTKKNRHICLPRIVLDDLKSDPDLGFERSMVHTLDETSAGTRDALIRCYVLGEGEEKVLLDESWDEDDEGEWSMRRQLYAGSESTYLHFAARLADVPLVYECIRLGVDVNCQDVKGNTPLHCVVQEVARFHHDLVARRRENSDTSATSAHLKRLRHVAKVLLEQHADVHLAPKEGFGPVHWAWYALDLELIELFIVYGASEIISLPIDTAEQRPDAAPLWVANPAKVASLKQLSERLTRDGIPPRPPRRCPCWSGKPLSECHESGYHLWPSDFSCICGGSKTYGRCCSKRRSADLFEKWDHERKRMVVVCRVDDGDTVIYKNPFSVYKHIGAISDEEAEERGRLIDKTIELNDLSRRSDEKADPAFRYVLMKYRVLPRPTNKSFTKDLYKALACNWNKTVDEYTALGSDARSALEIEQAAKMDSEFGPLWKRCEASGCTAIERPAFKMKCCSGCKRIYYCSATCQKAHWKEHKHACKRRDHPLQQLPSQSLYGMLYDGIVQPLHNLGMGEALECLDLSDSDLSDLDDSRALMDIQSDSSVFD